MRKASAICQRLARLVHVIIDCDGFEVQNRKTLVLSTREYSITNWEALNFKAYNYNQVSYQIKSFRTHSIP